MRRIVLVVLLVASIALITVSARSDALDGPRSFVLQAVAPLEDGLTRAWAPIAGAWRWGGRLLHAADENPALKARVDELETQVVVIRDIEAENERLRDALALKERGRFPDGYRQVRGAIIARSPTDVDRSIVIGLGSDDGVRVDDPVMVTRGLIGRVEAVSSNAARVGLIINQDQAVSATVVGSDATGVLRISSNEGGPVMELSYVTQRVRVVPGDLIVTSGWTTGALHSIYPRGIPIGVVSSVGNSPADLYKTVQVTPFADFDRIDEVTVLEPVQGVAATEAYIEPIAPKSRPLPARSAPANSRAEKVARRARKRQ